MALTPAVFHILLALAQEDRHGYGILKEVLRLTDRQVRLGPGTLYGTLQRLMDQGLVEETARASASDERRRYYRLTRKGRRALHDEVARMDMLLRTARAQRMVPRPSRG